MGPVGVGLTDLEPVGRPWWRYTGIWVGFAAIALVVGVAVGVALGWRAAMEQSLVSTSCVPLAPVDLEVAEIVALKQRWRAYVRDVSPDAHVEISTREATFLLRGESDLGVHLVGLGDRLDAQVTVPQPEGCYNVAYRGKIEVTGGAAVLDVEHLEVGGTDLTELIGLQQAIAGPSRTIRPEDVEDPTLRAALANIDHLEVRDGRIRLRFVDPDRVWR